MARCVVRAPVAHWRVAEKSSSSALASVEAVKAVSAAPVTVNRGGGLVAVTAARVIVTGAVREPEPTAAAGSVPEHSKPSPALAFQEARFKVRGLPAPGPPSTRFCGCWNNWRPLERFVLTEETTPAAVVAVPSFTELAGAVPVVLEAPVPFCSAYR